MCRAPRCTSPTILACAQRLAASTKFSHEPATDNRTVCHVLNALRHRRNSHDAWMSVQSVPSMCSTPCGIDEILTVLSTCQSSAASRCSTPCGIDEILTFLAKVGTLTRLTCSTQ